MRPVVNVPEEDRARDIGNMHEKFGKDRACVSGDILADRQTHRQTYSSQYFATAPADEVTHIIYNFIRHIGSHIQYKKAIYSKQNDEKVNNFGNSYWGPIFCSVVPYSIFITYAFWGFGPQPSKLIDATGILHSIKLDDRVTYNMIQLYDNNHLIR